MPDVAELRDEGDIRIVTVRGEVDVATAPELEERLGEAAEGAPKCIVSLAECRYIDSSGLRLLVRVAHELGERLAVVVPPGTQVRRIFDITGLAYQMDMHDALPEAIAALRT